MKILKNGEYYGQIKKELKTKDFILSEYSYNTPKTDWHYHEDPYFMYLLEGEIYDINKKREKRCTSGSLLFHNWQEQHYNAKHSKFAKGFHLEIKRDSLKDIQRKKLETEGSLSLDDPYSHILLSKLYYEFSVQDSFSNIGIESLIISLFANMEEDLLMKSSKPKWLQLLTDIIYEENEVKSLQDLSLRLGVHPVHISRTFSKFHGCTLSEFMRMLKIKKSVPYLIRNKNNLTEIAYICGFADQSHFTRTFKNYFKMSPSQFKAIRLGC